MQVLHEGPLDSLLNDNRILLGVGAMASITGSELVDVGSIPTPLAKLGCTEKSYFDDNGMMEVRFLPVPPTFSMGP